MTTTTTTQAIDGSAVSSFLAGLFGCKVTASEDEGLTFDAPTTVATYVDGEGNVQGQIVCDLRTAAALGAALTQIPSSMVRDVERSGTLPENLRDNLGEVLNIAVNLFPKHVTNRLVLESFDTDATFEEPSLTAAVRIKAEMQTYGECKFLIARHL
jgi:hypothetical protein